MWMYACKCVYVWVCITTMPKFSIISSSFHFCFVFIQFIKFKKTKKIQTKNEFHRICSFSLRYIESTALTFFYCLNMNLELNKKQLILWFNNNTLIQESVIISGLWSFFSLQNPSTRSSMYQHFIFATVGRKL